MVHIGPPQGPLSLYACLEEIAHLKEQYMLTSAGDEWTAPDLLKWLEAFHPQYLRRPPCSPGKIPMACGSP